MRSSTTRKPTKAKVAYPPPLPKVKLIESDGEPLESDWHTVQIHLLDEVVRQHLGARTDFFCGGNMFLYYSIEQAESAARGRPQYKGPDFFVVLGVDGTKPRKYWAVWEEDGRYPDVIVELLSPSTANRDKNEKKTLYAKVFGTKEYFLYDPDQDELLGYRLVGGDYVPIEPNAHGWLWSQQLGAYIGRWDGIYSGRQYRWIRLYISEGVLVPTREERIEQLAQKLRELGVNPDEL